MKATGIVRRIDELGRVVIPKEIRKTLRIFEGDPLEIYTDKDNLILKKYSPVANIEGEAETFAQAIAEISDSVCFITDTDKVVGVSSNKYKEIVGVSITNDFDKAMKEKKSILLLKETASPLTVAKGYDFDFVGQIIVPVLSQGDLIGAVVLLRKAKDTPFMGTDVKFASLGASFLAKRFG